MVLEIIEVQSPYSFHFSTVFCDISHYKSRSIQIRVKTLLTDCSSQRDKHFRYLYNDLSQKILEMIEVQIPCGFPLLDWFCDISAHKIRNLCKLE